MKQVLIAVLFLIPNYTFSQNYLWEIGVAAGGSTLMGDIGGTEKTENWNLLDIAYKNTRFSVSTFGRRMIDYRFYANFQLNYIYLYAHDKNSIGTGREKRNLSFFNHMGEALTQIEYHPIIIKDLGGKNRYLANLNIYISTGVGVLYQNPKAVINNQTVELSPLNTEGPGKDYSAFQFVLPFTVGTFVTFRTTNEHYKTHRIGLSFNYRFTYFDYLDDVSTTYPGIDAFGDDQTAINASYRGDNEYPEKGSQRGGSGANDHYLTVMLSYSRRINSRNKRQKFARRQEDFGKPKRKKK